MTPPRNQAAVNALRMLPAKWAVVLVGIAIAYVVLQPRLNQWFGWNLPSVAAMLGDEKPTKKTPSREPANKRTNSTPTVAEHDEDADKEAAKPKASSKKTASEIAVNNPSEATELTKSNEKSSTRPNKSTTPPKNKVDEDDGDPLYGVLKEIGRNKFESPAGLVYGPGSEEGHRLKHIARHLEDQPDRPGSHGVFKGDMKQFLSTIDEAYTRGKKGAKGTSMTDDDGSVVYEVTFDKAIGYIGGEAGGRKKNPASKKLRLVVRGSNVITAFPF